MAHKKKTEPAKELDKSTTAMRAWPGTRDKFMRAAELKGWKTVVVLDRAIDILIANDAELREKMPSTAA